MKVKEVMTANVRVCTPDTNLAAAAAKMWESNVGTLPVVTQEGYVVGFVTDRDICIGVGTRHRIAANISVREVMSPAVVTCGPDDDVHTAITRLTANKVRRLPVVDRAGLLCGVLSLDDLAICAATNPTAPVTFETIGMALKAICEPPPPRVAAATSTSGAQS